MPDLSAYPYILAGGAAGIYLLINAASYSDRLSFLNSMAQFYTESGVENPVKMVFRNAREEYCRVYRAFRCLFDPGGLVADITFRKKHITELREITPA